MGSWDMGNIIFCFSKVMVGAGRFVALCLNPRRDIWEQSLTILVNLSKHGPLRPSLGNSGQCPEILRIRIRILSRIRIQAFQGIMKQVGGSGPDSVDGSGCKTRAWSSWLRIRIRIDPHYFGKLDPDTH